MEKLLKLMMLFVMTLSISAVMTACGGDDPDEPDPVVKPDPVDDDEDPFADLYGYWLNADKSGAMEIVKKTKSYCEIKYYVYSDKLKQKYEDCTTKLYNINGTFTAIEWEEEYERTSTLNVTISTHSYNQIVLKKYNGYGSLSSYVFSRASESAFYEYLTNGGKGQSSSKGQLAGTNWSGTLDGTYIELSFKADGTFTELCEGEKTTSTYTELDANTIVIGPYTLMSNTFGEQPFNFEFNSNKSKVTFSNRFEKWTFTRKQ